MKSSRLKLFFIFMGITLLTAVVFRLPVEPFLEYDAKDIFLTLSGVILGAPIAFLLTIIVGILELFMVTFSGITGFIMNMSSTLLFVCIAAYIHNKKPSLKRLIIGCIIASIIAIFIMIFYNYVMLMSMNYSRIEATKLILEYILPFNIIKTLFNTIIVSILYKPLIKLLIKYRLATKASIGNYNNKIANIIVIILISIIIVAPIFLTLQSYL